MALPLLAYSFRRNVSVMTVDPSPSSTVLSQIEADLNDASTAYYQRRYQDAVSSYHAAEALIWTQIDPGWHSVQWSPVLRPPRDVKYFDAMLSASAEFLNALPIVDPPVAVRPRVDVPDPADPAIGLVATSFTTAAAAAAAADFRVAATYANEGNAAAAEFFQGRATKADAQSATVLQTASQTTIDLGSTLASKGLLTKVGAGHGLLEATSAGAVSVAGLATVAQLEGHAALEHAGGAGLAGHLPVTGPVVGVGGNGPTPPAAPAPPTGTVSQVINLDATHFSGSVLPVAATQQRTAGLLVGGKVATLSWTAGQAPALDQVKASVYQARTKLTTIEDLLRFPLTPVDLSVDLPHEYYYAIPLGLAQCYQAMGDWTNAEASYFEAANYQYLNPTIEAPYLWVQLAGLYRAWGDSLYQDGDAAAALQVFTKVIGADDSVPADQLYTLAPLKPASDQAEQIIAGIANPPALPSNLDPHMIAVILDIKAQLTKIAAGLDFWGNWANSVPIWTYDFLQSVAINFAQLAIGAERDFINFQDRADQGNLTAEQLRQNLYQSQSEVDVAVAQQQAAQLEAAAYQQGVDVATLRAQDSQTALDDYKNKSWAMIQYQAESTSNSGGDDGDIDQINADADALMYGSGFSDSRGIAAAAAGLAAARVNREYELGSMARTRDEMKAAAKQAQSELVAAQARAQAAQVGVWAAQQRVAGAQAVLNAFDSAYFTPDVWQAMGRVMYGLYNRYLTMALKAAKLMQQAYNFETDQALSVIRSNYQADTVKGLLAADLLMADIQGFTYDLITGGLAKAQPVKQTISLAERYPYAFETQLRTTGAIDFNTRLEDFDDVYPGSYAGRIESVEVQVDGIVPVSGISGTLTNSGISTYRLPKSMWPSGSTDGMKFRVQNRESLVLSDYEVRGDSLSFTTDNRMLRIFEGAGVASSWHLELPMSVNDIDYGALTDIRLVFSYKARFDPDLKDSVLTMLGSLAGATTRTRGLPLRWLYPDAFFHFQDTGSLTFSLRARDFRHNETKPTLTNVGLLVTTDGSVPASGLKVGLATPGHPAAVVDTTDGQGSITSGGGGAYTPLASGTALGEYTVSLTAADNPALVTNGKLSLTPIANLALVMEYSYTPRTGA